MTGGRASEPDLDRELEVDVAVVGAGGAGMALLLALDRECRLRTDGPAAPFRPTVAVIDPEPGGGPARTWCCWALPGDGEPPGVVRSWRQVEVVDRSGRSLTLDLDPLRYLMVPSTGYAELAAQAAQRLGARSIAAPAERVEDGPRLATVRTGAGVVRARHVFDSRPAPPSRPARVALLQHFRGWTVRLPQPAPNPDRAVLMDFRAAQPEPGPGIGFGYLLPLDERRALVEYTAFSRTRFPAERYQRALGDYLALRWPGQAAGIEVEAVEEGAIPMTDASFPRRTGRRTYRLGTAGGATRGSTGYTFAAMQRQAAVVARALAQGRDPVPPPAYPARHRWLDAVLLRALDQGRVDGTELLVRLFERNPPARLLAFLDGTTSIGADLAVMRTAPAAAMARATVADARARLACRARPACHPRRGVH